MTGYQSKKAAALDEDGMYLVHHTKRKVDDDDDIQVYKRPWVGLTQEEVEQFHNWKDCTWSTNELVRHVEATLRIKNT
jgi:hypothetical protein